MSFDVTPVSPVPISRGRTVIFDIVEYYNGMDNAECQRRTAEYAVDDDDYFWLTSHL